MRHEVMGYTTKTRPSEATTGYVQKQKGDRHRLELMFGICSDEYADITSPGKVACGSA
jgi:hypothetical protein